jgi:hypothetical protein
MLSADRWRDFSGSVVIIWFCPHPHFRNATVRWLSWGWIRLAKRLGTPPDRMGREGTANRLQRRTNALCPIPSLSAHVRIDAFSRLPTASRVRSRDGTHPSVGREATVGDSGIDCQEW